MKLILNTIRKIDNDQLKEFSFGDIRSLETKLAVSFLNPVDFKKINLSSTSNIRISSPMNSVIVKGYEDTKVPEGMILLPISIWSNQLTEIEEGEIKFKNLSVEVEATNDPVLSFTNLLKRIKEV
jgi:formylmethanofuran dehydrogenase subunit D